MSGLSELNAYFKLIERLNERVERIERLVDSIERLVERVERVECLVDSIERLVERVERIVEFTITKMSFFSASQEKEIA